MPNRNVTLRTESALDGSNKDSGGQFSASGKKRKTDKSVETAAQRNLTTAGGSKGSKLHGIRNAHKLTTSKHSVGRAQKIMSSVKSPDAVKTRRNALTKPTMMSVERSPPATRVAAQESSSDQKVSSSPIKKTTKTKVASKSMMPSRKVSAAKRAKDDVECSTRAKPPRKVQCVTTRQSQFVETASKKVSKKSVKKVTVKSSKAKNKNTSGKKYGFWRGPRLRRMASLNAQAKVHILYENEARSPPESQEDHFDDPPEAHKKLKNNGESSSSVKQSNQSACKTVSKVVKKRKAALLDDVRFQVLAPKRMASLNAQAILAASYSLDRSRKEKVTQVTAPASTQTVAVVETIDSPREMTKPTSDENVDTIMQVINAVACQGVADDCTVSAKAKKKISGGRFPVQTTIDQVRQKRPSKVKENHPKRPKRDFSAVTFVPNSPCDQTEPLNLRKSPGTIISDSPRRDTSVPVAKVCSLVVVEDTPFVAQNIETPFDVDKQNDYHKLLLSLDGNQVGSPTVGFLPGKDHAMDGKTVEVKSEAIRRDKIEDTAEVTITGMYINPVTNTSQSFCISRIHTYKQATSTHSCYSPTHVGTNASIGVVDMHQQHPPTPTTTPPLPPPLPPPSSSATTASGGGLLHGGHMLHGGGGQSLYPVSAAAAAAAPSAHQSHTGMSHGDVAGIPRHYGSAFTVPHYGHHQPLPYGYYQPAGPMIQTVTTDPSCLIHKPVPFHPSGHPFSGSGDRMQQQQSATGSLVQSQQPFPVDQCCAHPAAPPYPPPGPGPGPGRQQQVYAGGGGGGVVISAAVAAASASSSSAPPPPPPASTSSSRSTAACGGGTRPTVAATAAAAATTDKCQPTSGHVSRAPPSPPSELYFADGCQSCYAAAAVHASTAVSAQRGQQQQRRGHYARPSRGSPSAPPPPPSPSSSSSSSALTPSTGAAARFHRIPSSMNSVHNTDQESFRKSTLSSQTKPAVKMETSAGVDAADLQDGYANPAIAAAAKTPSRNGRQQLHLHRNKSSPPSADVVSMATSNGQRVAHIGHATPKEARLTVSLEDVLRKTATATTAVQWLPSVAQQRQLHVLHVDVAGRQLEEEDDAGGDRQRLRTQNGSLTRSKALKLARMSADCVMKTRSGGNGLAKRPECRSKFGIRDVTNERRSMHDNEERTRNGHKRNLLLSPSMTATRQSTGRSGGPLSLLPPASPQLSPTTRSSRSTATSKGPSVKRLSIPCLKWHSSSSSSLSTSSSSSSPSPSLSSSSPLSSSLEAMTQNHTPRIRVSKKVPRYSNGWTWEGNSFRKAVYLTNDDPPVIRWCYSSMRHEQGDVIRVRDCILLKSGPRKADLPYVAKVAALWENPEDGEMMVSMLWYYRPEHTEQGRRPHHMVDEIFASKHRDVNSVACIEDKCHVLTFNEYCRYKCRIRILDEGTRPNLSLVADLEDGYPRKERQPPGRIASELVFFCRKVYDFRQKRILKNPS